MDLLHAAEFGMQLSHSFLVPWLHIKASYMAMGVVQVVWVHHAAIRFAFLAASKHLAWME